jgi:hypothetical protein
MSMHTDISMDTGKSVLCTACRASPCWLRVCFDGLWPHAAQVLDWFQAKGLKAYSVSFGSYILYNSIFPKHKERLHRPVSELVMSLVKQVCPCLRELLLQQMRILMIMQNMCFSPSAYMLCRTRPKCQGNRRPSVGACCKACHL